jgi:hypothetical protein
VTAQPPPSGDLPEPVRRQLREASRAEPPGDLLDAVTEQIRATPQRSRWASVSRLAFGLGSAAIAVALAAFIGFGQRTPATGPSPVTDVVTKDGLSLALELRKTTYRANEPITAEATLTYTGAESSIVISGSSIVVFSVVDVSGTRDIGGGSDLSCQSKTFVRNTPTRYQFAKSGGWSADDKNAAFYEAFFGDPLFRLPEGIWDVQAIAEFTRGTDCSPNPLRMVASVRIVVGPAAPTPSMHPTSKAGVPKCETLAAEVFYHLVGWRQGRVVVLANTFHGCADSAELLSADPAGGGWRSEEQLPQVRVEQAATDGMSVAAPLSGSDSILVIDGTGRQHTLDRPAGVAENLWIEDGLSPLTGGGYLVVGAERLLLVAPDGAGMTSDPLPSGYVAVAPTTDPLSFVLTRIEDARRMRGLYISSFRAYLWSRTTGSLTLISPTARWLAPSTNGLIRIFVETSEGVAGNWWTVTADAHLTLPVAGPTFWCWLSPDGSLIATIETPPNATSSATDVTVVRDRVSGAELARFIGSVAPTPAWDDDRVAILFQSQLPRTSEPEVVIVRGKSVIRLALP